MSLSIGGNAAPLGAPETVVEPVVAEVIAPAVDLTQDPPAKGSEGYEAWLTASAEASLAAKETEGLILGKFKTQGDLEAAYKEAQAELTRTKQAVAKAPVAAPLSAPAVDTSFDKYVAEIQTAGAISEASYKELSDKGYPKSMVDNYVAGQQAIANLAVSTATADRTALLSSVGGDAGYAQLTGWASTNLSAAEIARFDSQVESSKDGAAMAIEWLQNRYTMAQGSAPSTFIQGNSQVVSSNGFASQAEAVTAMSDKRYKTDPAYRAVVEKKLANKQY